MKTSRYTTVLFDLDGTLINSKKGVTQSVRYALKRFDIEAPNLDELEKFIGPLLKDSFQNFYSFSEQDADKAVDYYREYYSEKGIYENEVYAGIPALLEELKSCHTSLAVATKKPTYFAKIILEHLSLSHYFAEIVGSNMDNTRSTKKEIIGHVLQQMGLKGNSSMMMIGDRKYDIAGAKACGLEGVGVLYGFGSREELEKENPLTIVETVEELKVILLD